MKQYQESHVLRKTSPEKLQDRQLSHCIPEMGGLPQNVYSTVDSPNSGQRT